MQRGLTLFLKIVIIFTAIGALSGMIWFPQTEGRATNLDLFSIYRDPFVIYIYIASIPFFTALRQAFKLLEYVDENKIFSQGSLKAVRYIKYCAGAFIGFIAVALFYIRFAAAGDDPAGPTALGILVSFVVAIIATVAAVFQKILQKEVNK